VTFTVPSEERAKAFGVIGAISGGGAAIGLILGGTLTEYLLLALVPRCKYTYRNYCCNPWQIKFVHESHARR
jgi:MFS family permease